MGQNILPPLLLVDFFKMNPDGFLILCYDGDNMQGQSDINSLTQCPSAIFDFYFLTQLAVHDLIFPFNSNTELLLLDVDRKVPRACPLRYGNNDIYFTQFLLPGIRKGYVTLLLSLSDTQLWIRPTGLFGSFTLPVSLVFGLSLLGCKLVVLLVGHGGQRERLSTRDQLRVKIVCACVFVYSLDASKYFGYLVKRLKSFESSVTHPRGPSR